MLAISQHPRAENMGDFPSKAHSAPVRRHVRPYFINMENLPLVLPRAPSPSSRQGCAETLGDPYIRGLPIPRIPLSRELQPDAGQTVSARPSESVTNPICYVCTHIFEIISNKWVQQSHNGTMHFRLMAFGCHTYLLCTIICHNIVAK